MLKLMLLQMHFEVFHMIKTLKYYYVLLPVKLRTWFAQPHRHTLLEKGTPPPFRIPSRTCRPSLNASPSTT
jgi:hypothetical protein